MPEAGLKCGSKRLWGALVCLGGILLVVGATINIAQIDRRKVDDYYCDNGYSSSYPCEKDVIINQIVGAVVALIGIIFITIFSCGVCACCCFKGVIDKGGPQSSSQPNHTTFLLLGGVNFILVLGVIVYHFLPMYETVVERDFHGVGTHSQTVTYGALRGQYTDGWLGEHQRIGWEDYCDGVEINFSRNQVDWERMCTKVWLGNGTAILTVLVGLVTSLTACLQCTKCSACGNVFTFIFFLLSVAVFSSIKYDLREPSDSYKVFYHAAFYTGYSIVLAFVGTVVVSCQSCGSTEAKSERQVLGQPVSIAPSEPKKEDGPTIAAGTKVVLLTSDPDKPVAFTAEVQRHNPSTQKCQFTFVKDWKGDPFDRVDINSELTINMGDMTCSYEGRDCPLLYLKPASASYEVVFDGQIRIRDAPGFAGKLGTDTGKSKQTGTKLEGFEVEGTGWVKLKDEPGYMCAKKDDEVLLRPL